MKTFVLLLMTFALLAIPADGQWVRVSDPDAPCFVRLPDGNWPGESTGQP